MNDKKLLELAAKAVGYEGFSREGGFDVWNFDSSDEPSLFERLWNPLVDNHDALMLAVKLNITICRPVEGDSPQSYGTCALSFDQTIDLKERDNGDPYAATRRAIVRAAAKLGESLL